MHEFHGGLGFRHKDDLGEKFSMVGHCLVFVFRWAHMAQLGEGLFSSVCEFRAIFFVSSQQ